MHGRDHEEVGNTAIEPHLRGSEVRVPLLKHDACLRTPDIGHRRAEGPPPAGTILKSQPMNGRILVRWSNAQAMTVVKSWRGASCANATASRPFHPEIAFHHPAGGKVVPS